MHEIQHLLNRHVSRCDRPLVLNHFLEFCEWDMTVTCSSLMSDSFLLSSGIQNRFPPFMLAAATSIDTGAHQHCCRPAIALTTRLVVSHEVGGWSLPIFAARAAGRCFLVVIGDFPQ
jgi:hypothetical protein